MKYCVYAETKRWNFHKMQKNYKKKKNLVFLLAIWDKSIHIFILCGIYNWEGILNNVVP